MMAILVTGGAGFIGSHTCVELLEAGYEIVVVDNFSNSSPEALRRVAEIAQREFTVYELDLLHRGQLNEVFAKHRFDAVIHFAGLKAVGESVRQPLTYYYTNVGSTLILCETMKKYGVRKLVFSSSATVYGSPETVPIPETAAIGATNPYGRTKQMIEQILHDLVAAEPDWGISLLRYFNPVGAHKSGRIGEDPKGIPNNLLPYISQVAIGKLEQLQVFGGDYDTIDGTGVRDYIHVVDLAQGHLKALDKLLEMGDRAGINVYNLGTGRGYSVLEMVAAFEKASNRKVTYCIGERRPGDIAACYADTSKANKTLGWSASRGIHEMCEDIWRWQSLNPHGFAEDEGSVANSILQFLS